jgi:hypothetical protein
VYNNVGALAMQKECIPGTSNYEINLNEQAAGIYFIRIEGEHGMYNQKVNLIK